MLRVVLGYVNADVVEGACVRAPVRRDRVAADGQVTEASTRDVIAAAVRALVQHVHALRDLSL
jgi:hypothetical protein